MNKSDFEKLLLKGENKIVDFKEKIYDINNQDSNLKKFQQASFIKDLLAFVNTIRESSAYIIIGIKDKSKEIVGIDKEFDDNDFQQLVVDKLTPRPEFSFYIFNYKKKKIGIFEIPLQRLEEPVFYDSKIELPKIELRKVYYRKGSRVTEATELERIQIRKWLNSISFKKPIESKLIVPIFEINNSAKPNFKTIENLDLLLKETIIQKKKGNLPYFLLKDKTFDSICKKIQKLEMKEKISIKDREKLVELNETAIDSKKDFDFLNSCIEILIDLNNKISMFSNSIDTQLINLEKVINRSYWKGKKTKYDAVYQKFAFSIFLTDNDLKALMEKSAVKFSSFDSFKRGSLIFLGLEVSDLPHSTIIENVIPKLVYELCLSVRNKTIAKSEIEKYFNYYNYAIGLG